MGAKKRRVDDLLVERGLASSRDDAQRAIIAGEVSLSDRKATSGGELVSADEHIQRARKGRFVSRGGEKLAGALEAFSLSVEGMRCVDVGASTGGFTDCLLQAGAASVTAIDVGYGDLAWSLRCDPRVTVIERTNVKNVDPADVGAPFDLAVTDVSFIPLERILPVLTGLIGTSGLLVTLVKPQFEARKNLVGNHGVVCEASTHIMVIEQVLGAARNNGLVPKALAVSPIRGPEGNIEFLLLASKSGDEGELDVEGTVRKAHRRFGLADGSS